MQLTRPGPTPVAQKINAMSRDKGCSLGAAVIHHQGKTQGGQRRFQNLSTLPTQQEVAGTSQPDSTYEVTHTQIVFLIRTMMLLCLKRAVPHIYETPTSLTWRTQKAQLYLGWSPWHPHYFQCPCSDCRVWVYIVSNHRDTCLTFGNDACDHGTPERSP